MKKFIYARSFTANVSGYDYYAVEAETEEAARAIFNEAIENYRADDYFVDSGDICYNDIVYDEEYDCDGSEDI